MVYGLIAVYLVMLLVLGNHSSLVIFISLMCRAIESLGVINSRKELVAYSTNGTMVINLDTLTTTWTRASATPETWTTELPDLTVCHMPLLVSCTTNGMLVLRHVGFYCATKCIYTWFCLIIRSYS
jgi:hypothetical protein